MTVAEVERWTLQYRWGNIACTGCACNLGRFTVAPSSPDLCRTWAEVMVPIGPFFRRGDRPISEGSMTGDEAAH